MRQLRSSWRSLFCLVLLCCCLAGCGQTTEQPQTEAVPEGVIVDSVGRQVELPEAPQRVAALDSFKSGTGEIAARLTVPDTSRSFQILPQGICNSFLYGIVPDCVFVFRVSAYKY